MRSSMWLMAMAALLHLPLGQGHHAVRVKVRREHIQKGKVSQLRGCFFLKQHNPCVRKPRLRLQKGLCLIIVVSENSSQMLCPLA